MRLFSSLLISGMLIGCSSQEQPSGYSYQFESFSNAAQEHCYKISAKVYVMALGEGYEASDAAVMASRTRFICLQRNGLAF